MGHSYRIIDVFAERRYAGNQLAVVLDAGDLATEEMQAIALEMNFSETTFVTSNAPRDGGYDVRIFTPKEEIPFAGHPTLGTAYVIRRELAPAEKNEVVLNLGVGPVPVSFEKSTSGVELAWMRPPSPSLGVVHSPDRVAPLVYLSPDDVDSRFPVQEASVGISFLMIPLKTLDAIERAGLDLVKRAELVAGGLSSIGVFLFCPQTRVAENDLHARMLFEAGGVREDPATGSANACLAAYLVEHRYFARDEIDVRVEQGYEIDRPSLLLLRARRDGDAVRVAVGGGVVAVARGELL